MWNLKADAEASGEERESRRRFLARVDVKMGLGEGCRSEETGHTGALTAEARAGGHSVCWGLA